jgi:hypothetical protein
MKTTLRMNALLAVLAVCLCVSLISCAGGSGLKITGAQLTAREFTGDNNATRAMAAVTGVATNSTDSPLKNCSIAVTFYDGGRNSIGTASSNRESLNPGEAWNFTVQLTSADAWKARSYSIDSSCR